MALVFLTVATAAQQVRPIDWDFSYLTLLEKNNVGKDEVVRRWLSGVKSPAENWVRGWKGKQIISSILIEYPAFHAAERQTIWLVRTADEAHYWELTEALGSTKWAEEAEVEEPFLPRLFDDFYTQARTWEQLAPKPRSELPEQVFPGYMGFISLYGPEGSWQMLLTFADFILCPQKVCAPGQANAGRLMSALKPLLIPESHTNYKHESEAEIAAMTPEQRIDEQILENDVHPMWASGDDKQSELITKYRRLDGAKGLSHIAKLIDSYHPKRQRSDRSHAALMMASDIDDRIVRLRASPPGREVIKAIERVAVRFKKPEGSFESQVERMLRFANGINMTDEAIQDTLWVRHRIKVSDEEMLKFANYLIERDPTYPAWSEQEFIRIDDADARVKNDLGVPVTQIYVMKNSQRFHQAYLDFKKQGMKE